MSIKQPAVLWVLGPSRATEIRPKGDAVQTGLFIPCRPLNEQGFSARARVGCGPGFSFVRVYEALGIANTLVDLSGGVEISTIL
jgi:hypothetical protein